MSKRLVVCVCLVLLAMSGGCMVGSLIGMQAKPALRYGVRVGSPGATFSDEDMKQAIAVLEARLEALGVDGARVARSSNPNEDIEILLPAVENPERVKKVVEAGGNLELRPVVGDARTSGYPTIDAAKAAPGFDESKDAVLVYKGDRDEQPNAPDRFLPVERPVITTRDIRSASAVPDQFSKDNFQINFTLKPSGAEIFSIWTGANIGRDLAIVLDGVIRSAPRIQSQIKDRGQITGKFSKEQAEDLAAVLAAGELPGQITIVSETDLRPNR